MNSATFSKYKVFLFLIFLLIVWQIIRLVPSLQPSKEIDHGPAPSGAIKPVLVSVFYEALCPDSKNFIVKQLLPAVNKAPRLLNVSLIPYGKAKTEGRNGNLKFTCQHGANECLANKIHACAISKISNTTLQVAYISCMISDNMIPELIGENCAKELGNIDWLSILQCSDSEKGSKLLEKYGNLTEKYVPRIAFVPTILLDNKFKNQAAILKDFFKELCSLFRVLPEECIMSNVTSP